jgi:non-ribosomal peptide synthetase component F/thioesterase domain-containing protein
VDQQELLRRISSLNPAQRDAFQQRVERQGAIGGVAPLSFAQERMWLLERISDGTGVYNEPMVMDLDGPVRAEELYEALKDLTARHHVLRTQLLTLGGDRPLQIVAEPDEVLEWSVADLSGLPPDVARNRCEQLLAADAARPFDLAVSPIRAQLIRFRPDSHRLLLNIHHVAFDDGSVDVMHRELVAFYEARVRGVPADLPVLTTQYIDYAAAQRVAYHAGEFDKQIDYWIEQLAGAPEFLDLPVDRPRTPVRSDDGGLVPFSGPVGLAQAVRDLARREQCTPYTVALAAWQLTLARYAGTDELLLGTPVSGRTSAETVDLIGLFVNTIVIRTHLGERGTFSQLLAETRTTVFGGLAHQDLPFDKLVERLGPRRTGNSPLFQVMLAYGQSGGDPVHGADVAFHPPDDIDTGTAKFDMTIWMDADHGKVAGDITYHADLFDRATTERLASSYVATLEAMTSDPGRVVSEYPAPHRDRVEVVSSGGSAETVHEMVERQARRTPDAIGLRSGTRTMTYAELDGAAERLADRLRAAGAGPGQVVALPLARSPEFVVAAFAALKSGAAYLPLHPAEPLGQLVVKVVTSGAEIVLDSPAGAAIAQRVSNVRLVGENSPDARPSQAPTAIGDVACVLFTAGTSGEPKAVRLEHRRITRSFGHTELSVSASDVCASYHPVDAYPSLWDTWAPLTRGATVVVAPELYVDVLHDDAVTVLGLTPSRLRVLADALPGKNDLALRLVMLAGERLDVASLRPWFGLFGDETPSVLNTYGTTETGGPVTCHRLSTADLAEPWRSPIGEPWPDIPIRLLDSASRPVPAGVTGEIHVAGLRTGDLARWTTARGLDHVGRVSERITRHWHKVEIGEITAALDQVDEVRQCHVRFDGDDIVAYLVTDEEPNLAELRRELKGRLLEITMPDRFVRLPVLPLTSRGTVDRHLLPAESSVGTETHAESAVESVVLDVFRKVLNRPDTGLDDDFFELGGHSLAAVRMMHELGRRLGGTRMIGLSVVFRARTARDLAAVFAEADQAGTCLVRMADGGDNAPLFLVHAAGGNVLGYAELAKRLGTDRPVYGFSVPPFTTSTTAARGVNRLAEVYADELVAAHPGPYLLGGWSAGGVIAAELAKVLQDRGETVDTLVLLDPPVAGTGDPGDPAELIEDFVDDLEATVGKSFGFTPGELRGLDEAAALAHIADRADDPEGVQTAYAQYKWSGTAIDSHHFTGAFTGRALLVRAEDEDDGESELAQWLGFCPALEVIGTPGDHYTMLATPAVDRLAGLISTGLISTGRNGTHDREGTAHGGPGD